MFRAKQMNQDKALSVDNGWSLLRITMLKKDWNSDD